MIEQREIFVIVCPMFVQPNIAVTYKSSNVKLGFDNITLVTRDRIKNRHKVTISTYKNTLGAKIALLYLCPPNSSSWCPIFS